MSRSAADSPAVSIPDRATASEAQAILFDVGHPAHVHLFRNAIEALDEQGHETFVTSRDKEVTNDLLEAYDIEYTSLSTRGDSLPALIRELLTREVRLLAVARSFDPDVIVSRLGPAPAHVSALVGARHVVVSDTHIDRPILRRAFQAVTLPFVDTMCVPDSFEIPMADHKRRSLDFQELAYLHPRYFDPDPTVLDPYDIDPDDPFFVIRVAGWDAFHDVGFTGLSPLTLRRLVGMFSKYGRVFISAEQDLPSDLEDYRLRIAPQDIHHVLYFANLYVGDSGTMSTEAAVLGTPAIRTNTMVGDDDENVFRELEDRYGLLRSFADEQRAFRAVERMLEYGIDRLDWRSRRDQLLEEQPDVTARIVETILESPSNDEQSTQDP